MAVSIATPARLHVSTKGSGRPVILIHGWPLSGAAWEGQVDALADAGFQVITYDRRGFGDSDKPAGSFDYNILAGDLAKLIEDRELQDVTLVGFSMGGGEVARYVGLFGEDRLHSVVFAASVTPFMLKTADNPDGPLTPGKAAESEAALKADRTSFFDSFAMDFFSAGHRLMVSEEQRQKAIALCHKSNQAAAVACMRSFGGTDFRKDLAKITVPTLVLHGDADGIVDFNGSGKRTHAAVAHSELVIIEGAPHGMNVSHAEEFNSGLVAFLKAS